MPSTRPATVRAEDLPAIATVAELAAWDRCDPRTLRADLDAGKVPGAYRRGRSWRIVTATYLAALSATAGGDHDGV
jgi:hypothetical protein